MLLNRTFLLVALLLVAPLTSLAQSPAAAPPQSTEQKQPSKEIQVDTKVLAGYVGRYQFAPDTTLTIRLNGDHLFAFAPGQPLAEMHASSPKDFFLDAADTTFTFVTDDHGKATELVMHLQGQDHHAARIAALVPHN